MSSSEQGAPPELSVVPGEDDGTGSDRRPVLRIVQGKPTDTEIAALTATLTALSASGGAAEPEAPVSYWASRGDRLRHGPAQASPSPGRGAWRYSTRPR
ncbi:acyl-CoA carboxylase epsilon subunit [Saccharopolyspora sp. NFXS83]|uniref:acyl-CoA carboxylase epsilon subunit n=1 Tax=Saccharopolyspora sp. NFXS83 TaxID=2993560 RepID=UPI00224B3690|nr:acyl-CoA carboxylase epsilon subunit [Saccharopolyspora sp. NFXS83]MCX2730474.1 acyl-CoA carboxylase epsilon subunit [Saccharopolyspora sp. NFXS83]